MPNSNEWLRGDGEIPLTLEVQFDFIPVSGIEPTVQVLRFTDETEADWSTNMFVPFGTASSGQGVMTTVSGDLGLYRRNFNPAVFGETGGDRQIYYARFRAVVPSGFTADVVKDIPLVTHELEFFRPLGSGGAVPNEQLFASFINGSC